MKKFGEDDEISSETELPITLSITHNLTQSETDNIKIQWILEIRIQSIERKQSGWKFQRIITMGISFYKSGELNGSSFVNVHLRSSAVLNIKIDDMYCFIWSIVARLHPCEVNSIRVSSYKQYFLKRILMVSISQIDIRVVICIDLKN